MNSSIILTFMIKFMIAFTVTFTFLFTIVKFTWTYLLLLRIRKVIWSPKVVLHYWLIKGTILIFPIELLKTEWKNTGYAVPEINWNVQHESLVQIIKWHESVEIIIIHQIFNASYKIFNIIHLFTNNNFWHSWNLPLVLWKILIIVHLSTNNIVNCAFVLLPLVIWY